MAMAKGRGWLAAAVFLLVLAACTSTAGRPGPRDRHGRHPVRRPVPGPDATADGGAAGELLRDRPQQRGQLRRAGLRAGPEGCVYPAAVQTLGNQLSAAGRSWAAYLQDMGNDPARDNTAGTARRPTCGHPATWAIDHNQKAAKVNQYAGRHDAPCVTGALGGLAQGDASCRSGCRR
jgi:hypothetical protein